MNIHTTHTGFYFTPPSGEPEGAYHTDHLGNIRLRYAINPVNQWLEILEEDHYYPFGLKHQGYNAENYVFASLGEGPVELIPTNPNVLETYKYKLNSREWQDELGLNMFAMDMRQYDPAIGRWIVQDPVTHFSMSPYVAFDNNPVFWADPSGADSIKLTGDDARDFFRKLLADIEAKPKGKRDDEENKDKEEKPDFQFEKEKEEQIKKEYPKFYNLIKNQMKNITADKNIIEAFSFWSGYSIAEIEEMLQYDSGAIIRIHRVWAGIGFFDPSDPNAVQIDSDYLNNFEKNYIPGGTSIRNLALIFHATMSVLHEVTHKGEWEHGKPQDMERGNAMQAQIYGNGVSKYIGPDNPYDPKLLQYVKENQATLIKIFRQ